MNTCGECSSYNEGKCSLSGYSGCEKVDLLTVGIDEIACDSFSEVE